MSALAPQTITLVSALDMNAAEPLLEALKAARGQPVDVDAAEVARSGTLCLQVLLSAAQTWQRDGVPFRIISPSEAFVAATELLGLTPSQLAMDGAVS